jgi:A/G-specific adenine glycosylase
MVGRIIFSSAPQGKIVERAENNTDIEDLCTMCEPFPDTSTAVTRYPMKIEKKKAREQSCAVSIIEYRTSQDRWFLLVRRPEKGL